MRKITAFLIFLLILQLQTGCTALKNKKDNNLSLKTSNSPEYVFIVIMDAVRYRDGFGDKRHLYIENIWEKLKPMGAICTKLYNYGPTFTIPSHINLLTGKYQKYKDPEEKNLVPEYPTIFEYYGKTIKSQESVAYFVSASTEMKATAFSDAPDYGKQYAPVFLTNEARVENKNAVYEKFIPSLKQLHPSFNVLSLTSGEPVSSHKNADDCLTSVGGAIDACGGSVPQNAYYESIIVMDNMVFDLWNRIQEDEIYKGKTVLLVLTDHGRHTNDYSCWGDNCDGCSHLMMLAIGPGIKKNFVSKKKRELIDVCPTIGALLNIPTPYSDGKIMEDILEK